MNAAALSLALLASLAGCLVGAPLGPDISWVQCRNRSMELNSLAKALKVTFPRHECSTMTVDVEDPIEMIEAQDQCDPSHLSHGKNHRCLKKIRSALRSFSRVFGKGGLFQRGTDPELRRIVDQVDTVVTDLLRELGESTSVSNMSHEDWQVCLLQPYSVNRLFSFSIITARVFSAGVDVSSRPGHQGHHGHHGHHNTLCA